MRRTGVLLVLACLALAACGGKTQLIRVQVPSSGVGAVTPKAAEKLGFPFTATKNTTRVAGADPVADAAGVAQAVFPSAVPGTHPRAVVIAPTYDWEAALAASVLMAAPVRAPLLLSGKAALPSATLDALKVLAPSGSSALSGAQIVRIGDVPAPTGLRSVSIRGNTPFALAAAIDNYATAAAGKPSPDVVIASADQPAYAMPAAGWAAESGDPILYVTGSQIPDATKVALLASKRPNIYVLGPPSVVPDSVLKELATYGRVKRVGTTDPAANSVAFAAYRDPPCPPKQPCVHVPGSFGWALTSPGHGYTLGNANRPLDAAAAAPLSAAESAAVRAELLRELRYPGLQPGGADGGRL
jgi:hypothetical protein